MRVVYAISLSRGGPLSHLRDLAPEVARAGIDVKVVCGHESVARDFRALGLETAVAPLRHKLDARGTAGVWPHLSDADVVHTHDRRTGLLVRPQGRFRGAHAVHTLHGVPDEVFVRVGRAPGAPLPPGTSPLRLAWSLHGVMRIEALLSRFGTVVVPSHALERFLVRRGFPARRLRVIHNGIAVRRTEPRPPHDPLVVGTVAVLEYRKGVDLLIDACARLDRPLRLEVFGDGAERSALERQAARLDVDARFHGFVDDLRTRLDELDVFVLPTRADNLPIALLEAMGSALPVVATRVGGNPEVVEDGESGLLVEPEDAGALAAALERLASEDGLRERLAREGARRAAERFDTARVAERMVALYEELCASST
jgi:glycosyltransferase involved in cell wall biosynthesis